MSERNAHSLFVELADVILDFVSLDAGEFRQLAERVHAFASLEGEEDVVGERVELLPDHRGGDGGESLVRGGVVLLGFPFACVVVHGEFVLVRGARLTQVFSNRPLRRWVRHTRTARGCRDDSDSSSSGGRCDRCDRDRCRVHRTASVCGVRYRSRI